MCDLGMRVLKVCVCVLKVYMLLRCVFVIKVCA